VSVVLFFCFFFKCCDLPLSLHGVRALCIYFRLLKAHEAWSVVLSTSFVGSLLALLAVDIKLGSGFYDALDHLTSGEWPAAESLANPLLLPATTAFLLVLPAAAIVVQAYAFNLWQASAENATLPPPPSVSVTVAAAAGATSAAAGSASASVGTSAVVPPKREASVPTMAALEGDKGAFNYVNPLDLPPKYEQFCGPLLFRNADALMYFFGFQVRIRISLTWMRICFLHEPILHLLLLFYIFHCLLLCFLRATT
jgi:hypothetical protein